MLALRSLLFQIFFYGWSLLLSPLSLPVCVGPYRWAVGVARFWLKGLLFFLRACCGLGYEIRGYERLPDGPFFIAAKHQSMWDTMIFHLLLRDPAYILKRELLRIPLFGWFLRRHRMIAIDRAGGSRALRQMVEDAKQCVDEGRTLIIFPEGTRLPPGRSGTFHSGVALLYASLDIPVVPVALNSGLFWGKLQFIKKPGTITLEFLPPIKPGLDRKTFMDTLRQSIDENSERLRLEAFERFPLLSGENKTRT